MTIFWTHGLSTFSIPGKGCTQPNRLSGEKKICSVQPAHPSRIRTPESHPAHPTRADPRVTSCDASLRRQGIFVGIAWFNFLAPDINESTVQDAFRWRRSSGHRWPDVGNRGGGGKKGGKILGIWRIPRTAYMFTPLFLCVKRGVCVKEAFGTGGSQGSPIDNPWALFGYEAILGHRKELTA